jgi:hypothetical protein
MDAIDDSVLEELQQSIQAIESSFFTKKDDKGGDDNRREDYDDDEDDDDYDYNVSDTEGEDLASSEAELAAMMDGLVAELQAEIQEQILQDYHLLPQHQPQVEGDTNNSSTIPENLETMYPVHFEKLDGVSSHEPDYTSVQDYTRDTTGSPTKQRRGKREMTTTTPHQRR